MAGCIPPKVDVYPAIQANNTVYVNTTPPVTSTPTFPAPPEVIQTPDFIIPPSAPNPYLNQTIYHGWDYYYPEKPSTHYTPWMGGWYYYQAPVVTPTPTPIVFWTGTASVTVIE